MKKTNVFILIGILLIIIGISLINYFDSNELTEIKETHTFTYVKVNIRGEVLRDGVYEVPSEWVLNDLLSVCGVGKDADLSKVDLLELLEANKTYYIPSIYEVSEEIETSLININLASQEELERLPGIGPSLALAIIQYREIKSFESIEEIMEVTGIGSYIYEKIKTLIIV